jgi:AhpD family alkylhydroperoxidase
MFMKQKTWLLIAVCVSLVATSVAAEPKSPSAPPSEAAATRAEIERALGFVPAFMKALPDSALPGAWEEFKTLQISDTTAVPCKIKELIGLAVAAQIPCKYCTYAHTEFAKLSGASQQELGEAVVMAALARHWSTFMNGIQLDDAKFKKEIDDLVGRMKSAPPPAAAGAPAAVSDAKSARAQAQQMLGAVPEFLKRFPDVGVAGAWREWRDVELSPATALSGKYKSLIGLAVSAQIPCKYCTYADTTFAKLEGASDAEIAEAIAMASVVRHWSTLLNGLQIDEVGFRKDVDRIVAGVKAKQKKAGGQTNVSTTKP